MEDSPKIMVIDDEPTVLNLLETFLLGKGIPCITCESPVQALETLKSSSVKLVLLDVVMPELTGQEVLEKITKLDPDIKVIMVTGLGDMDVARECLENGAVDYIQKPIDLEYLENSIFAEMLMDL